MQTILLNSPGSQSRPLRHILAQLGCRFEPTPSVSLNHTLPLSPDSLRCINAAILDAATANWYHVSNMSLDAALVTLPHLVAQRQKQYAISIPAQQWWGCSEVTMCLLLPEWSQFLTAPNGILYVDHPLEVAHRLQEDWQFPLSFGAALWEFYYRAALRHSSQIPRTVVSGEQLKTEQETAIITLVSYFRQLGARISEDTVQTVLKAEPTVQGDKENEIERAGAKFLNSDQLDLYTALTTDKHADIETGSLSGEAEDILRHFGRLRFGYERIKSQGIERRDQKLTDPTVSATDSASHEPDTDLPTDMHLIDVTVELRDLPSVDFTCAENDPTLKQLLKVMVNRAETEGKPEGVFYLELEEKGVYFPVSELAGVELHTPEKLDGSPKPAGTRDSRGLQLIESAGPSKKVAIVVLGCLMPVYETAIDTIMATWASRAIKNIDIYFAFGAHVEDDGQRLVLEKYAGQQVAPVDEFAVRRYGRMLVCGCADAIQVQQDCLLRKRLFAFHHLLENFDYDFFYTVCASSYVDQSALGKYVDNLDASEVFHGPTAVCEITGRPYVSGASMLLSADLVKKIVNNKFEIIEQNQSRYADDVAIGSWIANHVSTASEEEIARGIEQRRRINTGNTFVRPHDRAMINYVDVDPEKHRIVNDAYHYHFKTDDIEHMVSFHQHFQPKG